MRLLADSRRGMRQLDKQVALEFSLSPSENSGSMFCLGFCRLGTGTGSSIQALLNGGSTQTQGIAGRADLYEAVGHEKSLEGIRLAHHHYSLYRGRENVRLWVAERDAGATASGAITVYAQGALDRYTQPPDSPATPAPFSTWMQSFRGGWSGRPTSAVR